MSEIYVDADGCPVKDEVFKVAKRYEMKVHLVANKAMKIPLDPLFEMIVVHGGFDAADDWIEENISSKDIAITIDIPLASRCLKKGAQVLGYKGDSFSEENIGEALATRELMSRLREMGQVRGGPAPFEKKDRSNFLSKLDRVIQVARKNI